MQVSCFAFWGVGSVVPNGCRVRLYKVRLKAMGLDEQSKLYIASYVGD